MCALNISSLASNVVHVQSKQCTGSTKSSVLGAAGHPVCVAAYMGSQAVATQPPLRLTLRTHSPGCWLLGGYRVQPAAQAVTPKQRPPYRAASRNDPGQQPAARADKAESGTSQEQELIRRKLASLHAAPISQPMSTLRPQLQRLTAIVIVILELLILSTSLIITALWHH